MRTCSCVGEFPLGRAVPHSCLPTGRSGTCGPVMMMIGLIQPCLLDSLVYLQGRPFGLMLCGCMCVCLCRCATQERSSYAQQRHHDGPTHSQPFNGLGLEPAKSGRQCNSLTQMYWPLPLVPVPDQEIQGRGRFHELTCP
jgi:hypothetical protein